MARLEIELAGVNSDLKRVLKESKIELSNFSKGLDFNPKGVIKINDTLKSTKQLLKDIISSTAAAKSALSGLNQTELKASITQAKLATAEARAEAAKYRAESVKLTNDLRAQKVEQEKLNTTTNQGKTVAQSYRTEAARLSKETAALRLQTAQNRTAITAASGSYREAQLRLTALGKSIREAEGGFRSTNPAIQSQIREYRQLNDGLKKFDAQLGNHQRQVGNYGLALQGLGGLVSSYFGFTALLAVGRQVLNNNAKISDSLADVRRTAGLTAKEAENLSQVLKNIDTRTNLADLLGIATIGGQLGIAKNQLSGFVEAIDQLAVALGGELQGGAEGVAKSLGVLDNVFGVTASNSGDVRKAYNQIGSAVLALGQEGLATGDFLADFGERVGGVAKQAGIALPTVLAFGAVLQENGVSAEVAGTSFKKLISALANNSEKFFQVAKFGDANLTLKEFNTLVNTDTKRALDALFKGLSTGGKSTIAFNTILKQLKLSQSGVSQSVAALVAGQGNLNKYIALGTTEFQKATLAGEQFEIKNNTLAGSIDKLGKAFENVTSSGVISEFFKSIVDGATASVEAVGVLSKALSAFYNLASRPKEFIAETALTSRQKANQDVIASAQRSASVQIKNQVGQKEAFELLKREAKLLGDINDRYLEQKVIFDNTDIGDRTLAQVKAFQELQNTVRFQKALVSGLKTEYDKLYRTVKRSDTAAPELGGSKDKSSKSTPVNRAAEILRQSGADVDLTGLKGVDKQVETVRLKYQKFYADLVANAKKSAEGRATLEMDLATLQINEASENAKIIISEQQRVEEEVSRINNIAAEKVAENKSKEIAQINKRYDSEILKAGDSTSIVIALEDAKLREIEAVNDKFEAKRIDKQIDLNDKIQALSEKDFTLNERFSNRITAKNKEALNERLKDVEKHFEELRKLNATNPLALLALGVAEGGIKQDITGKANTANNAGSSAIFKDLANSFTDEIVGSLRNIKREADQTFGSVIGKLGTGLLNGLNNSVTDIFVNQFKNQFSKAITDASSKLSIGLQGAIAGAGLLGGAISSLTKPTSGAGQGIGGAISGAATGAALGSIVPGIGTAIGAVAGGLVGLFSGIFGAKKARKEEAIQKAQLEEQKKQTALQERANALAYSASIIGRQTVNGVVTGVEVNEFGQLTTKISGQDIAIVLDRANKSRQRGT